MEISGINSISINTIHQVMSSSKLTAAQKTDFLRENRAKITEVMHTHISSQDYKLMMKNRPLKRFRPLKNSFTKRGDKILLAQSLGIEPVEVDDYIDNVCENIMDLNKANFPDETMEKIRTYIYRHGKKQQVIEMLDYELTYAKDKLKTLYGTLDYDLGGIADYFHRPIHRMDDRTIINLYDVIEKHLDILKESGEITEMQKTEHAKYVLTKIYEIQNNNTLIKSIGLRSEL